MKVYHEIYFPIDIAFIYCTKNNYNGIITTTPTINEYIYNIDNTAKNFKNITIATTTILKTFTTPSI